jgi:hypothetical protein
MFDDPEALFYDNVLASYQAFIESLESDPHGQHHDTRLAINAATALYHYREHVGAVISKTRKALAQACPDYDLLGDIVNASKHGTLTKGAPQIASADAIFEVIALTEYRDADGPYWHATKAVKASLDSGIGCDLRDVLTNVLNMWIAELQAVGLLNGVNLILPLPHAIPPRSSASGAGIMHTSMRTGASATFQYQIQRYNYSTREIEAVDISGQHFEWTLSKSKSAPAFELEVIARNEGSGQEVRRTVVLSQEEAAEFERLTTDEERRHFGNRLIHTHGLAERLRNDVKAIAASDANEDSKQADTR